MQHWEDLSSWSHLFKVVDSADLFPPSAFVLTVGATVTGDTVHGRIFGWQYYCTFLKFRRFRCRRLFVWWLLVDETQSYKQQNQRVFFLVWTFLSQHYRSNGIIGRIKLTRNTKATTCWLQKYRTSKNAQLGYKNGPAWSKSVNHFVKFWSVAICNVQS